MRCFQDRSCMLVSDRASAIIRVANCEAKEPLTEARTHRSSIAISGGSLGNQVCLRLDIPVSIAHKGSRQTFIKHAMSLARVKSIRLSLLNPCPRPVSRRRYPVRLAEEYRCRNHYAADLEVSRANRRAVISPQAANAFYHGVEIRSAIHLAEAIPR